MKKTMVAILAFIVNCNIDKYYYIDAFDFHFQSDLESIGLSELKIVIDAEKIEKPIEIDSSDFSVCPDSNDTCDGKGYYEEVPFYTQTVLMTKHSPDDNFIRESDGKATIRLRLDNDSLELLDTILSFDSIKDRDFYLIYLGYKYDEDNYKISNFIKCLKGGVKGDGTNYYSFPITGSQEENDSLFLIWME